MFHESRRHANERKQVDLADRIEILDNRRGAHRRQLRALALRGIAHDLGPAGDFHLPARVLFAGGRLVQQQRNFGPRTHLPNLRVSLHRRQINERARRLIIGKPCAWMHHAHTHLLTGVRSDRNTSRAEQRGANAAPRFIGGRRGGRNGGGFGHRIPRKAATPFAAARAPLPISTTRRA